MRFFIYFLLKTKRNNNKKNIKTIKSRNLKKQKKK